MKPAVPLALLAALTGAAPAAAQWSAPQTISAPHTFVEPLQLHPGPVAAFAWQDGTSYPDGAGASVVTAGGERPAPAGLVASATYRSTGIATLSQVPVDGGRQVRLVARFGTGTPQTLATGIVAGRASLSVAPDGRALATWIESRGGRAQVRVAYRPSGRRFGAPSTLIGSGRPTQAVGAAGAGADLAVLALRDGRVVARTRPRGGSWRALQTLARPSGTTRWDLRVAVSDAGNVQAVWRRRQYRTVRRSLEAASALRGRAFGTVQRLVGDGAGAPVLRWTAAGFVVAHPWSPQTFGVATPRVHLRAPGHPFADPTDVLAEPVSGLRDVAVTTNAGRLAVAWVVPTPAGNGGGRGAAALAPYFRPFGPPEPVTPDEQVDEIELAPEGTGFRAAWTGRPDGPRATVVRTATRP
jgi:hypothetical protein